MERVYNSHRALLDEHTPESEAELCSDIGAVRDAVEILKDFRFQEPSAREKWVAATRLMDFYSDGILSWGGITTPNAHELAIEAGWRLTLALSGLRREREDPEHLRHILEFLKRGAFKPSMSESELVARLRLESARAILSLTESGTGEGPPASRKAAGTTPRTTPTGCNAYPDFQGDGTRDLWQSQPDQFKGPSHFTGRRGWAISEATIRMQKRAGKIRAVTLKRNKVLYFVPDVERENPEQVAEENRRLRNHRK
jgi:hypothetical protein